MDEKRKREHLQICLDQDVRSGTTTGLERYRLVHQALPEMALEDVDTAVSFLGRELGAPILISAMTGGTELAYDINRRLALAAQEMGLAMGLGSQRAGIEEPALMETYGVRDLAPDILLLANLGAVQLNTGYGLEECLRAVESVGADALVLHLNPLQEALQPEGNTDFGGLLDRIAQLCRAFPYPVIVKEVGWGLSAETARALEGAGAAALDIGGAGGTSWSEVERHRSDSATHSEVAGAFLDWGIPTAESLNQVRRVCPNLPLVASGGLTDGTEVAVCLALGANLAGMAQALLRPAADSAQAVGDKLRILLRQLRIAMFCSGARTISDLDGSRLALRN